MYNLATMASHLHHSGPTDRFWIGHFDVGLTYGVDRPAGSSDWLLVLTVAGCGIFSHNKGSHPSSAGNAVLIAPNTPHGYRTDHQTARWKLRWAHFKPEPAWIDLLDWPALSRGFLTLTLNPPTQKQVIHDLAEALRHVTSFTPHRERLAATALQSALLHCDEVNPRRSQRIIDPRIKRGMDALAANDDEPFSLDRLGRMCSLSPSRAAHLFREQVGMSPQRFYEMHRMERARQWLELSDRTVAEIAHTLGYECPFYFSRRFKVVVGTSPSAYRQKQC